MKNNLKYVLLIAFFGVLSTGCSSDDNNSPNPNAINLVGKWHWDSMIGSDWELDDCSKNSNYQFYNNGTAEVSIYLDNPETGDCLLMGIEGGEYELLPGNRLKFIDDENDVSYAKIESYTGNSMILVDEDDDDFKLKLVRE